MVWKEHEQVAKTDVASSPPFATCANGETRFGYGSPEYLGLGFSVIVALISIEIFGSVFFKKCNVIIALLFGYFVAAVSNYQGENYVLAENIKSADPITFLWVETFPLGLYCPAVVPLLISYVSILSKWIGVMISQAPTHLCLCVSLLQQLLPGSLSQQLRLLVISQLDTRF
jgi:NCS2 family nucleobase:cation symporter-2